MPSYDVDLAEEGLKFLTRKEREGLHPRGQVQKLRRIAVRAMSDADWRAGIPSKQHPHPPKRMHFSPEDDAITDAHIAAKRRRAAAAVAAMLKLNYDHKLGY